MQLRLEIKGASSGVEAAKAVFTAAGISAQQAADGMFALEDWDDASFAADEEPTAEEDDAASIGMAANKAAIAACCANWPPDAVPDNYLMLELVY